MKKLFFTLLALVGTMSMNAQIINVYDGDQLVLKHRVMNSGKVVFEAVPVFPFGQGEAEATGIGIVKWIQLWDGGPKFAEYNVGVTDGKAESYGGYYAWGGSKSKADDHNTDESNLSCTGDNITDTATKLWGSKWRMPTKEELDSLLAKCTVEWTNVNGLNGCKFTGKGDYSSNSVFLPAAGHCNDGKVGFQDYSGDYWSSTPFSYYSAYCLDFYQREQNVYHLTRDGGYSVRAVLNED